MTNEDISLRTYFQDKIKAKEPELFLTAKTPGKTHADSYSRVCQSSQKRQPVILTKNEYSGIIDKYPEYKTKDKHIIYGTGPNKYYYICPQYWNTRTNMPISDEEMKENNLYDHIIDNTHKKITDKHYIYHLIDNDGKISSYPNFIFKNGQCAPCCFKKNTPKKISDREKCNQSFPDESVSDNKYKAPPISKIYSKTRKIHSIESSSLPNTTEAIRPPPTPSPSPSISSEKAKPISSKITSEYIKNAEKFPLEHNRLGIIPPALQNLFMDDISKCAFIQSHKGIEPDYYCVLRSGIPLNSHQSFLECIADMYSITIDALKFKISNYLTIDNFIKLQNGNLVTAFYDPNLDTSLFMDIYDKAMDDSNLYKLLVFDEDYPDSVLMYNKIYFDKVFIAYINFMHNYLFKTTTFIDHTYMWDIILQLYDINLCIFEIKAGTNGDEVQVVCPTNKYSVQIMNPKVNYDLGFIIKKNEYYEPVYIIKTHNNKISKKIKLFNTKQQFVGYTVNMLLKIILTLRNKCSIQDTPNLSIVELFRMVSSKEYVITHKIMDYSTQIVGLRVGDNTHNYGVIPCIPSTMIETDYNISSIPIKLTTSRKIWSSFKDTIRFYDRLDATFLDSTGISRLPKLQYVLLTTNNKIEGFITNYNQLIEVTDRLEYNKTVHSKYPPYKGNFMTYAEEQKITMTTVTNTVDKDITPENILDAERIRISGEIEIETIQYAFFRNIVKTWLRKYEYWRSGITHTINECINHIKKGTLNQRIIRDLYDTMITLLDSLTNDEEIGTNITFLDEDPVGFLESLADIDINTVQHVYLVNNNNNKVNYYIKLAEELLFNNRLRRYILDENTVSLYKKNYDIYSTEILLSDSSIIEYYDSIVYNGINKFPTNRYYDETNPSYIPPNELAQLDTNIIASDMIEKVCDTPVLSKVATTSYIKRICIPSIQKNMMFLSFSCVYSLTHRMLVELITNIPEFNGMVHKTHGEIRTDLIKIYNDYLDNSGMVPALYTALSLEGKKSQIKYLQTNHELTISNLINMPTYTLTAMDYMALCSGYNIPAFVIHEKLPMYKRFNSSDRVLWVGNKEKYTSIPDKFFCIVVTWSPDSEDKPVYALLSSYITNTTVLFSLDHFEISVQNMLREAFIQASPMKMYLNKYVEPSITIHPK